MPDDDIIRVASTVRNAAVREVRVNLAPWPDANVIISDNAGCATRCPQYAVTLVPILRVNPPSTSQQEFREFEGEPQQRLQER